MELQKLYINLSQASVLIPIVAGVIHYKVLTRPFKILFYFFVISALTEISSIIAIALWRNNLPGLYIYTALEFSAFSLVFYQHTRKGDIGRKVIGINMVILILIVLAEFMCNGMSKPNDISRGYSSSFLSVYTLCYFYYLFYKDDILYLWEYPMFWICTGMLIYFGVNTLYFMTRSYLLNQAANWEWGYNYFHGALNIIAYYLYAQSFRCLGKRKTAL